MAQPSHQEQGRFSDVKNGPKHPYKRSCTDVFCCLLFTINIGVLIAFALYGYTNGDTTNVYRATDQAQNICGGSGNVAQAYPYTYFYNPSQNGLNHRVCVKSCPYLVGDTPTNIDCLVSNTSIGSCSYTVTVDSKGKQSSTPGAGDVIGYDTYSVIGRVCVPTATVFGNAFASFVTTFNNGLRQAGIANFIVDIQNNWQWLLAALGVAVLMSLLFMFFLRCFAGCFIWVSLILIFLVLTGAGILFLYNGGFINNSSFQGNFGISVPNLPSFQYYNILGWITLGVAVILLIVILCCCGRITLAVKLCGVAGQFIASTCQVMLVPIVMSLIVFAFWVFALYAMVTLIGTANFVVKGTDVFTSIQDFTSASLGYFYYFVFGSLWTNAMLQAIAIFVIASSCAVWYFNKAPGMTDLDSPVSTGYWMAFRYHFGSLAFGAFILALVQFIQFIFEIFNSQVQAASGGASTCFQYVKNCVRCCLQCLKRIIQFLNKNAYIQISITGKNFCGASGDAVAMIMSNPLRYTVVAIIGWILALVGKLLIAGLTTFLFYLFITFVRSVNENIQEPIYMLILVGLVSLAIASIFMAVFEVSADTLLVCFIIDEQANTKPQYVHPDLAPLLD